MYYTYILINKLSAKTYIGSTSDLKARVKKHQSGEVRSTKYDYQNYELFWYCAFNSKKSAVQFELYLKSGSGRAFIKKRLINP